MKKPFLTTLAAVGLLTVPFAASASGPKAETFDIYGWQNHSWEFVDENGRNYDRIQSNAGNIGFKASITNMKSGIKANFQCEQFTYFNHFAGGTGWCNRNSKIGLSHDDVGEIMFATWLLPYNEGVAAHVDPFYDAGADSHTSIMGSVGAHTIFYNTGDFDQQASNSTPTTGFGGSEFNYAGGGYDTGFNRRQENILQYWSPNWGGFVFRFAWTAGRRDEMGVDLDGDKSNTETELDPMIRSSSLAYTRGPLWLAVSWQDHEDWTAASVDDPMTPGDGVMRSSDAESWRLAGNYQFDMGGKEKYIKIAVMYEDLEYEFNGVTSFDAAMRAFGYPSRGPNDERVTYVLNNDDSLTRAQRDTNTAGGNVTIEREAWMVSGKVKFGGPFDMRFSYMDADDLEISCSACSGDWNDSAADAWNVGLFYTMSAGTELRLTYSEVDNDNNGTYGQGISGSGLGVSGSEIEMFALGIVQWFD